MKVADVMTREVITVDPETPLKSVAEVLTERRISGVPVVDGAGGVIGVVSEADIVRKEAGESTSRTGLLVRLLGESQPEQKLWALTAGEAMTSPPIVIALGRDVAEAARLIVEQGVNRLPVLDGERLVGIVTRADLVRAFVRSDEEIERELREDVALRTLWIDPNSIEIAVERGVVTLGGEVQTKADAELLERFTARVPGVAQVRSQLRWRIEEPKLPSGNPRVPVPPRSH